MIKWPGEKRVGGSAYRRVGVCPPARRRKRSVSLCPLGKKQREDALPTSRSRRPIFNATLRGGGRLAVFPRCSFDPGESRRLLQTQNESPLQSCSLSRFTFLIHHLVWWVTSVRRFNDGPTKAKTDTNDEKEISEPLYSQRTCRSILRESRW